MQHRTDEVPHDCGRRARLAEQTAVRSRRVRHIAVFGIEMLLVKLVVPSDCAR